MKTIPIKNFDAVVSVRLKAASKAVRIEAILDTGASQSVVDKGVIAKLGVAIKPAGFARQVRGYITKHIARIDSLQLIADKPLCSIGPLQIGVATLGGGLKMLVGSDVLNLLRAKIRFSKKGLVLSCKTPDDMVEVLALGRYLGAW